MWRFLLLALICLAGCKSKQYLGNEYPNCKYGTYSKDDVIHKLDSSSIHFNWMKIKTKVDVEYQEKKYNLQVQLRVRNDSAVFAKVSKSGITAIKLLVTKDTVVFVDRINKNYFNGHYSELQKLINVSVPFGFIQNLFLSQPTFLFKDNGYKKVQEPLITYSSKAFDTEKKDSNFHQTQSFTCDSLRLKSVSVFDGKTEKEVRVNYDKYGDINGYPLNKKIYIHGMKGEFPIILADIELKRIKTFDDLMAPIDIPDDYKRLEIK